MTIPTLETEIDLDNYAYEHDSQGTWYLQKPLQDDLCYVVTYGLNPPGTYHALLNTTTDTTTAARQLTDIEAAVFKTRISLNPIPNIKINWDTMQLIVEDDGGCYLRGTDTSLLYEIEIHIDPKLGLFATFYENSPQPIAHRVLSPEEATHADQLRHDLYPRA